MLITTSLFNSFCKLLEGWGGGGREGVLPYISGPYRYVPPLKVWDLCRFGFKTDIDFAHVGLESCNPLWKGIQGSKGGAVMRQNAGRGGLH